ncbi:MAG: O-antigen ligase family protein [Gemmatimonadaceae bacterium]|nr:O-antigen ligase family protein [Gemmatimonadaceae bacterium]
MLIRVVRGQKIDATGRVKMANVLFVFLGLEVAAVVALEVYGIARGGDFRSTLFQIRNFIWLPLQTAVFAYAMRDTRDFRRLALVITAATMLKAVFGIYFYVKDGLGNNYTPDFITGHTDTVLYVSVLFLWVAAWMHHRSTWQRHVLTVVMVSWFMTAIVMNDRRLAWVSLVGSLLAFYPLIKGRQKRRVNIGLICFAPFITLYFSIASKVSTGIFKPGAEMLGMSNVEDTSSLWRVLENQNLVWNLRMHRILGSGFGHEWIEFVKLPDISGAFEQYRLVAHNSLLWIFGISGVVGFTFLWLPIVVGVFLATRSYHAAQTPLHRTAAATVIAVAVCYVNQAWGDIGLGAPLVTLLMAIALALAAKLSTETDSWPLEAKLT